LIQLFGIGEKLLDTITESGELREVLLVELVQDAGVLGVTKGGIDGREMFTLSELLVETPEDLYDTEGGAGDWIGEISSGRTDGSDDTDGSFTPRATKSLYLSSTLIEAGKLSPKVGRETLIGRHFS
jgi:hypothetical protein